MAKNYTNYDAISLIKECVDDDKLRFPFVASCVLTGTFNYVHDYSFNIGNKVDDRCKLYFGRGVFAKLEDVFAKLNQSNDADVNDLIIESTEKNFHELEEEIRKFDSEQIIRRCSGSDLYTFSLRFGFYVAEKDKDIARKEIGQRSEQLVINLYKNKANRLITNSKRIVDNQKLGLRREVSTFANVVEDTYQKYRGYDSDE